MMSKKSLVDVGESARRHEQFRKLHWTEFQERWEFYKLKNDVKPDDINFYIAHTFWWELEDKDLKYLAKLARDHFYGIRLSNDEVKFFRDKWIEFRNKLHSEERKY